MTLFNERSDSLSKYIYSKLGVNAKTIDTLVAYIKDEGLEHECLDALKADEPLTDEEYVKAGGLVCPACKHDDITAMAPDMDGPVINVPCSCYNCNATWTDQFNIVGYMELKK